MVTRDLREWLEKVEQAGKLKKLDGADWNLEIGCLSALNVQEKDRPALLFDNIKGYPSGYRVLTSCNSSPGTLGLTFGLSDDYSDLQLVENLRQRLPTWEGSMDKFPPEVVKTGPVLENVLAGDKVDILKLPVPKYHDHDGGRYIGTGDAVITRDPDNGAVNLGTYRVMVHDKKTTGLYISPGKHGRVHCEKHYAQGKPCPVAVSVGHHPLILRVAGLEIAEGMEYNFIGAIRGEPVKVIREEVTGLLIPAESEIVIAGWSSPGKTLIEGPFGEYTGYYASKERLAPIIEVERVYYRNNPVILGAPPARTGDSAYSMRIVKSATLFNDLVKAGVTDVRGAFLLGEGGSHMFAVVSIKQRYGGHAKRAALIASQSTSAVYMGRYVVVVDEDIDPSNMQDVMWALCTRSDPERAIDIVRETWSSPLDPMIRKPTSRFFNSRAIINACKPFDWIDEFPQAITIDPGYASKVKEKWGGALNL